MFGRSRIKPSTRKRLLILLAVAVLFPVFILVLAQAASLGGLDKVTRVAVKENLRQNLLDIGQKTAERFESIAAGSLVPAGKIELSNDRDLERHFSAAKHSWPEIEQIFLFAFRGGDQYGSYGYIYTDSFRKFDAEELRRDEKLRSILGSFIESQASSNFLGASRLYLFRFEANSREYFVFYPLAGAEDRKPLGFAGIRLHRDSVRDGVISPVAAGVIRSREDVVPKSSDLVVRIFAEDGTEIFSTAPDHREYVVETNLGPPFSNWNAKIGYRTTKFESLVGMGYRQRIGAMFFFLFFLIAGIVLTVRAAIRELQLAQMRSGFVSNVSHELKTPVSLISLFAEILEDGRVKSEEKKHEYYRVIRGETRRLNKLIENILDFSRIEDGRKTYDLAEGNIGEVIEDLAAAYRYQITGAGFELTTNIQSGLPPVLIDRDAIAQAILNLLDNAVKYSTDVKRISIMAKAHGSGVLIEIADNGIGIARKERKKIFEKFYRVGNDLVHNVKGSGLGLALVKHIVEAHHGKITVASKPGGGSCFSIVIPAAKAEKRTQETREGEAGNLVEDPDH